MREIFNFTTRLLCVLTLCGIQVFSARPRCLRHWNIPGNIHRRKFTHGNREIPLSISQGSRLSSQITANIVAFLLEEALGYDNVVVLQRSATGPLDVGELSELTLNCNNSRECIPSAMIQPEVLVPFDQGPKQSLVYHEMVDVGPLGSTAGFGWYVLSSFVQKEWQSHHHPVDHWRTLQISSVLQKLLSADHVRSVNDSCTGCIQRVFYPRRCDPADAQITTACALLVAQDKGNCSSDVERQIISLNLSVVVAWIAISPVGIATSYESQSQVVLFGAMAPDALTTSERYTKIDLPDFCSQQRQLSSLGPSLTSSLDCLCPTVYEFHKFVWKEINNRHDDIHKLLQNIFLQRHHLAEIIQKVNALKGRTAVPDTVCDWLVKNNRTWLPWIFKSDAAKNMIYIGGMFPSLEEREAVWSSPGDEIGAQMAVERVNRDTAVLMDYRLELPVVPTQCRRELVSRAYIEYLNRDRSRKVVGILGPACSKATIPIAEVSRFHNMILMGYGADDVLLSDRRKFPFYFRTAPNVDAFKFAYMSLFNEFGWKRCVTLREIKYPATTVVSRTEYFTQYGVEVMSREMPSDSDLDANSYVDSVKASDITIIILNAYPTATRSIMCEAFIQGLHPANGYVWFVLGWLDQDWWDIDKVNSNTFSATENIQCSSEQMKRMVDQGYFSLSALFYGEDISEPVGGGNVADWKREYTRKVQQKDVNPSDYATLAYDAVWTYALALDKLLRNSSDALDSIHSEKTSRIYREFIQKTDFQGVSGRVHFRDADRLSTIVIKQNFATRSTVIGRFVPTTNSSVPHSGFLKLNTSSITWASEDVPRDSLPEHKPGVKCAVESFRKVLGVKCGEAGAVAAVIAIACISIVLVAVFWVLKGRYSAKYRRTKARLKELGLLDAQAASAIFALDEWEIPRDRIILNRKLGQGAFGAVFGGEGLGVDDRTVTVPVAVKTLKTGATVEEKLEFLSEAYTMKHFSHRNTIALYGVCAVTEPVFIVMELLIHGDLKSFLLARRRLIDQQGTPEAEDVTPHKLTSMALDIACGLEYLSRMKFVHRDLALRNCMVGLGNVVKIGDFGLARALENKDYYRFERKGVLPIRWMAPEAIKEGLFTRQTDVWSYGVTLWELATFGGFPYQGMSNREVLERVKDGYIMDIPEHSSEHMATLLRMCWRSNPLERPTSYGIVQILTESPELVRACVEVPPTMVTDTSSGRFDAPKNTAHARNKLLRASSVSSQLSEKIGLTTIKGWSSTKIKGRGIKLGGSPLPKRRHPEMLKRKTSVYF